MGFGRMWNEAALGAVALVTAALFARAWLDPAALPGALTLLLAAALLIRLGPPALARAPWLLPAFAWAGAGAVALGAPLPALPVATLGLFLLVAPGAGMPWLRRLAGGKLPGGALLTYVAASALGFFVLGMAAFALAWFSATRGAMLALLLAWAFAGLRDSARLVRGLLARLARPAVRRGLRHPALLLPAACLLAALLAAPAPPTDWDGQAYHLFVPRLYLEAGRIVELPEIYQSNYPLLVESVFLVGLALGNLHVAPSAALLFFLLSGLLVFRLARAARAHPLAPPLALAAVWCSPTAARLATAAYVDLQVAGFALLALALLLEAVRCDDAAAWRLFPVACGMALTVKYSAIPLVAILLALHLLAPAFAAREVLHRRPLARHLPRTLAAGLVACALFAPFAGKNIHFTGNPLYPYFHERFPTRGDLSFLDPMYTSFGFFGAGFPAGRVAFPFHVSTDADPDSVRHLEGNLGPLFLPALLAALVALLPPAPRDPRTPPRLFGAAGALSWSLFFHSPRYVLAPAWALLALLPAAGAARPGPARRPGGTLMPVLLALALTVPYIDASGRLAARIDLPYLAGMKSAEAFLAERLPPFPAFQACGRFVPPDGRLLLNFENRAFYIPCRVRWQDIFVESPLLPAVREEEDAAGVFRRMRAAGYTHLLTRMPALRHALAVLPEEKRPQLIACLEASGKVFEHDGYALFAFPAPAPAAAP